ncbi:hypothetical protein [Paenibacillus sp. IHBB 10380]|uniref:hypothetical protein n=1 Tax=Paenibacillus sp. IHBB 10380 TaxID=1566358 RepID=UPI0005CFE0EB|nr:hypothetical protein [Paenibacillus sp. IHBB 10380]AJS58945.1 hypothetical protein UB51_11190 [Paenibacillus sp. IHBB 10380]
MTFSDVPMHYKEEQISEKHKIISKYASSLSSDNTVFTLRLLTLPWSVRGISMKRFKAYKPANLPRRGWHQVALRSRLRGYTRLDKIDRKR